jgi:hypothetical protein
MKDLSLPFETPLSSLEIEVEESVPVRGRTFANSRYA